MRKIVLFTLILALLSIAGVNMIAAQDATALEFGQYVEGEITSNDYEFRYTFNGSAGDVVSVEMFPKPGTYDIDGYIFLRDPDGDVVAENDDYGYPLSLVVAELPADGEYTIVATRSGGSTGSSEGTYWLRVSQVEIVEPGSSVEATITSNYDEELPNLFYLKPEASGPVTITFAQEVSELFGSLEVSGWDEYGKVTFANLDNTAKVSAATITLDLEAGEFYVLNVARSFSSYVFDEVESVVTITVE
ncbi:MAG: hypothetical protein JNJ78_16575 [Anaerolineae bacterium]|nr:hypothetical protein [Anaerolineae bacterium]